MKIFAPDNYFARFLFKRVEVNPVFTPASMITSEILRDDNSIGLIPVFDLLTNRDLFISSKYGISFDSQLCNSFFYFNKPESLKEIVIAGDTSSVEALLCKILFRELYEMDVDIKISSTELPSNQNYLLSGNKNFLDGRYADGLSLSEEVNEMINLPFVHYVLASVKKENIEEFHNEVAGKLEDFPGEVSQLIEEIVPPNARDYFLETIQSFNINLTEIDKEAIDQILRLPYFHAITQEIFEIKFV